jgi:hypothetical protein
MNHTTSLLTLTELAVALRVPENWLQAEADAGRIPCLRAGKRCRFALAAVEAALVHRAAGGDPMTAPAGSPAWRAAMVGRLTKRMEAVSRRHRRPRRPTKRQRPGSGNSRAVGDRPIPPVTEGNVDE